MQKTYVRETLWMYYKYKTETTRATLRKYVGSECSYIDDKATTDLAATIYKAWIEKHGCMDYPKVMILPRGVYLNDGSGSGLSEDAERDVSYHLVDEEHARRILAYNGDTWWQSLTKNIKSRWHWYSYKVRIFFKRHQFGAEKEVEEYSPMPAPYCTEEPTKQ